MSIGPPDDFFDSKIWGILVSAVPELNAPTIICAFTVHQECGDSCSQTRNARKPQGKNCGAVDRGCAHRGVTDTEGQIAVGGGSEKTMTNRMYVPLQARPLLWDGNCLISTRYLSSISLSDLHSAMQLGALSKSDPLIRLSGRGSPMSICRCSDGESSGHS
jgi:hypothetical protein